MASTKAQVDCVYPRDIDNGEVFDGVAGVRAGTPMMAKLDRQLQLAECYRFKINPVPLLQEVSL